MEWQQLEYFHTLAQVQHYTLAAGKLSLSQPALSRSIAKLEQELGIPLFDKQGRGVVLNAYGRMFQARISRILHEMTEAKREIFELENPEYGQISLAFLKSLGIRYVPYFVRSFLDRYPQVDFQLFQNSTQSMLEQLEYGSLDFCLSSMTETSSRIEWKQLWTEEMFIFVPNRHPLAHKQSITLRELSAEKFVVLKKGYSSRTVFDRLFSQLELSPIIAFEGEEASSIIGFVEAHLGITLLPQIAGMNMTNIARLSITDIPCERVIGLAWKKDKHLAPAACRFRDFLIDTCSTLDPADLQF
ncbi:LysR family transcriptional regulator [Paenibacillus oryzisoli]|uniref:LysR family transcriptional regulator n=1 Tax=Paenibacillus oryzisoli TaxID=1850517 RepID=A0A198AAF9_9BACL|nr:LysR family transcriptional regulator [Paenibacillus oryzisoli]OAS18152.1 LysR family transcriptional regulator [Paenibacillus oryzisoli]